MLKNSWILIIITLIGFGALHYNNHQIMKELDKIETPVIIQQADAAELKPDYLIPAEKEYVESVITKYYSEMAIVLNKDSKSSSTVKIRKKTIKSVKINIKDQNIIDEIAIYIKKKEGFRAKAYKDNKQYSNGYGTKAKSSTEVITVKEANERLYRHIKKVIIPAFSGVTFQSTEQVLAAIDFSYNIGHNKFKQKIVREDGIIDCSKMMAYNKMRDKNGKLVYNEGLAKRRLENFLNCSAYEIIK